jgi:tetrahedral aminopeptidase
MLLEKLTNAHGTSGYEEEVRELLLEEIGGKLTDHRVDALGNLLCKVGERDGFRGPRLLVSAHMDEVGMCVTEITASGALKFEKLGGIDDRVLASKRVLVGRGDSRVPGVVGLKSPHLHKSREEMNKVIKHDQLFIDIGAGKKEETEGVVKIGDPIHFDTRYFEQDGRLFGKAFDDRAGCAVIAEVIAGFPQSTDGTPFFAAFTTQEEVGVRGGRTAGYSLRPDVFIACEGTTAGDVPGDAYGRDEPPSTRLGDGPALSILDRSHIADRAWLEFVIRVAEEASIPYQFKRSVTGGTESSVVQRSREGVRVLTVSLPVRYIHSPVGVADAGDYQNMIKLVTAVIRRLDEFQP